MNILLINGSPHAAGCVATSLNEIAKQLKTNDISSEIFHIGTGPVQGCMACGFCKKNPDANGCVCKDEIYTSLVEKIKMCDGVIIGAPVDYAGPPGSLCALLDRVFYSAGSFLRNKPGACIVNCRRGGATATFDRLNKYFTLNRMPLVPSQYWNITHGVKPEDVLKDLEGLQTMRTLANYMAWMLKNIKAGNVPPPIPEEQIRTNFIRD